MSWIGFYEIRLLLWHFCIKSLRIKLEHLLWVWAWVVVQAWVWVPRPAFASGAGTGFLRLSTMGLADLVEARIKVVAFCKTWFFVQQPRTKLNLSRFHSLFTSLRLVWCLLLYFYSTLYGLESDDFLGKWLPLGDTSKHIIGLTKD